MNKGPELNPNLGQPSGAAEAAAGEGAGVSSVSSSASRDVAEIVHDQHRENIERIVKTGGPEMENQLRACLSIYPEKCLNNSVAEFLFAPQEDERAHIILMMVALDHLDKFKPFGHDTTEKIFSAVQPHRQLASITAGLVQTTINIFPLILSPEARKLFLSFPKPPVHHSIAAL